MISTVRSWFRAKWPKPGALFCLNLTAKRVPGSSKSMQHNGYVLVCAKEYTTRHEADESGIRTHASEETGALNQRLRPLGHLARADESGIRTHASEETGALNQRLRPLGHLASSTYFSVRPANCSWQLLISEKVCLCSPLAKFVI
uniref:Uncharacterized protein n=1 Tax=Ascaris lumbricoides TaxID=6252 RepID=A0A0M3IPN0_ASCLU